MCRNIEFVLRKNGHVSNYVLRTHNEVNSFSAKFESIAAFVIGILTLRFVPLQCLLFPGNDHLLRNIDDESAVIYMDGVRTLLILRKIRKANPKAHIIVDFDDLLSKRFENLLKKGISPSLGYFERRLSRASKLSLRFALVSKILAWYEMVSLKRAEREVTELADSVVFISEVEAAVHSRGLADRALRKKIHVVSPLVEIAREARDMMLPLRFVFVGSDVLTQNRLTIEFLIRIWRIHQFNIDLLLVGKNRYVDVFNLPDRVHAVGFAQDIGDIYDGRSVLLYPSFLAGGVKTKVLEAFAHGAPVVGNAATFECIDLQSGNIILEREEEIVEFIKNAVQRTSSLNEQTRLAQRYLRNKHSAKRYEDVWRHIIFGGERSTKKSSGKLREV